MIQLWLAASMDVQNATYTASIDIKDAIYIQLIKKQYNMAYVTSQPSNQTPFHEIFISVHLVNA